jgi:hypothetical protein
MTQPRALFAIVGLLSASWTCGGSPVSPGPATAFPNQPSAPVLRTYSGTVRAVDGGPLEGVKVTGNIRDPKSALSGASGSYTLDGITGPVWFTKDGYVSSGIREPSTPDPIVTTNVRLQPRFVLTADSPVSSVVSPDDLTYSSDLLNSFDVNNDGDYYHCSPCKEIFIASLPSRYGRLRLSWAGSVPLDMWVGEFYVGLSEHQNVDSTQQQLTIDMAGRRLDTILVGIGSDTSITQPIAFRLTFESAE